ncbi:MAG: LysR family transcriptional regulator [Pseudomonadota bacterium]
MSITLLRTLIAVYENGSFAAAAARVHVTQAAVGQQMRRLEDTLGTPLFDRSQPAPRLNSIGNSLIPQAREVVAAYDALMQGNPEILSGELRLGAVPSTLRGLVPQAVKRLRAALPEIGIRIVPGLSDDLLEQVERGALDAAISSAPGTGSAVLNWQELTTEPLVLIAGHDQKGEDPLELLRSEPFIRHTRRAAAGGLASLWLRKVRLKPHVAMEMESIESVASMVSHGLGVSIVPDICVPDPVFASLRKIPLSTHPMSRALGVLTRADSTKQLLAERLLSELRSCLPDR